MRSGIAALLTGTLLLTSGCAGIVATGAPAASADPSPAVSPDERIARDFARAIVQVPVLAPVTTTVRFDPDAMADDRLLHALQENLRQAGYAIQLIQQPGLANQVTHTGKREHEPGGSQFLTHEAAVGAVRFRRQYRLDRDGHLTPASALFVKGADASAMVMDDSLFDYPVTAATPAQAGRSSGQQLPDYSDRPASRAGTPRETLTAVPRPVAPKPTLQAMPLTASISAPLISQAQASARANPGSALAVLGGGGHALLPYTRNVFELGQSNFNELLGDYRDMDERVLVFGNDSMRLGSRNKAIIEAMAGQFDARRDVMSLVGCSLGPTRLANGNETLALGRANRVKEALVLAGVPQDRILDEGCWAGESSRKMPSRGVVVTHRRERG